MTTIAASRPALVPPTASATRDEASRTSAATNVRDWLTSPNAAVVAERAQDEVERIVRQLTGRRYALAVASGTMALLVALRAAGVEPGDWVALPDYDWPAGAAATVAIGAHPVALDVEPATGALSVAALVATARHCRRVKAAIVTHLGGIPHDVSELRAVCERYGVTLVEDCAQAMGATMGERMVGHGGHLSTYSLSRGKLVDAGEAGIITTDDELLYERAVRLSQHPVSQRRRGVTPDGLHFNARIHPLAPMVALPQFDALSSKLARRRANAKAWFTVLRDHPGFRLPLVSPTSNPSWWAFVARCQEEFWGLDTARVAAALQAAGLPIAHGPICETVSDRLGRNRQSEWQVGSVARSWCRTNLQLPCSDADPREFGEFAQAVGERLKALG